METRDEFGFGRAFTDGFAHSNVSRSKGTLKVDLTLRPCRLTGGSDDHIMSTLAISRRRELTDTALILAFATIIALILPMDIARAQLPEKSISDHRLQLPTLPLGSVQQEVISRARQLAAEPHRRPEKIDLAWLPKSYDDYKRLQLRRERAFWATTPLQFEIHPLPAGWIFDHRVEITAVGRNGSSALTLKASDFLDHRVAVPNVAIPPHVPLSGFRINGPLNAPGIADEIIAFQGASYFRALGEGHVYGLSARGLAIGTASASGEEFPAFLRFWIERPEEGAKAIKVYALLDSPSTTGAFSFLVSPGKETVVDVSAILFPRREISELGLAPLTSMFLLGPSDPTRVADFRPRVHDSDGLAMLSGSEERIWRPLTNPRSLQVSTFADKTIRGFGLIQRSRQFLEYQDLEARYERRPSLWVEPGLGFDNGNIVLVEIPTDEEIHDNIVVFFRPSLNAKAQEPLSLSYRLRWRDDAPTRAAGPWIASTRMGQITMQQTLGSRFVVDYKDDSTLGTQLPSANVYASAGRVADVTVQLNPETKGIRVTFVLYPEAAEIVELRLTLGEWNGRTAETWLYRWTKRK